LRPALTARSVAKSQKVIFFAFSAVFLRAFFTVRFAPYQLGGLICARVGTGREVSTTTAVPRAPGSPPRRVVAGGSPSPAIMWRMISSSGMSHGQAV
jgi:hypothetical protein